MCQKRCFTGYPPSGPTDTHTVPMLQVRSASSRGMKHPTQGHIACAWQSQNLNAGLILRPSASHFLACPTDFQLMDGPLPCPALPTARHLLGLSSTQKEPESASSRSMPEGHGPPASRRMTTKIPSATLKRLARQPWVLLHSVQWIPCMGKATHPMKGQLSAGPKPWED